MNQQREEEDQDHQNLDLLLAALGAVEATTGFEQRIARGVEARLADTPKRRPFWTWTLAFATATVILVAGVTEATRQAHAPQLPARTPIPATERASLCASPPAPQAGQTAALPAARIMRMHRDTASLNPRELPVAEQPSLLAPPEPLSRQEKLLLQVVQRKDPTELAMLDPVVREKQFAKDRQQVDAFFYKPPTIDAKGRMIDEHGKLMSTLDSETDNQGEKR